MSSYIEVTASSILVARKDLNSFYAAAKTALDDYFEGFFEEEHDTAPDDDEFVELSVDSYRDVGDSYPGRIHDMAKAIGPFLVEPVTFRIRTESMSDDRDEFAVAGPTVEAIAKEAETTAIVAALDALKYIPVASTSVQLRSILNDLEGLLAGQLLVETVDVHQTSFGPVSIRPGALFASSAEGSMLIACARREDGDGQVIGSINLDYLAVLEIEKARRHLSAFLTMHREADAFALVESVPESLELPKADLDVTSAPASA
ncbi:hypothetical protein [Polaromonas sp.]|uniref:hypothetical protein n=1 Tax=Polaromonas sp. TaxID=1869339 RepID=UPI00352ADC83